MSRITLDAAMLAKLKGITDRTALCDEQGNVIALLMPYEDLSHVKLPGPDPLDDAACAEALKTPQPARPLADIIRDLRKL
jgi:hypothetical protein